MNDIDLLMSQIEEINLKSADELSSGDIETLIAYHRHSRARRAAGEKPKKPSVDISEIMKNFKPTTKPTSSIAVRRL